MNKDLAERLKVETEKVAGILSNKEREKNFIGETFTVDKIYPLSDTAAGVSFLKDKSQKKVVLFFYFQADRWWRMVSTDEHCHAMMMFPILKAMIEIGNYDKNFEGLDGIPL